MPAPRDENRVPTLLGVSSIDNSTPTTAAVDPSTHEVLTKTTLNTGDLEIGAVEIKNSTDDTRAKVDSDGLNVSVKKSVLPTGAATSDNQTNGSQKTQLVNSTGDVASITAHGTNEAVVVHTPGLGITGNLTGLNSTVELDTCEGFGSIIMIVSGTWTGKIVFEGSIDSVWVNLSIVQPLGGITQNGIQNDNQNGSYRVLLPSGYTLLRARMSSYTSGTATVQFYGTYTVGTNYVWQLVPGNLQMTANQATGTNLHAVVDSSALPTGASTSANQTNGSQKTQMVDGSGNIVGSTGNALDINIKSGNITGFATSSNQTNGSQRTQIDALSTIYQNTHTVPTVTADAISTSRAIHSVTIKALSTNTVPIYIGDSTVTTGNGFELLAGESISLDVDNLSTVYCISGSAAQVLRYISI